MQIENLPLLTHPKYTGTLERILFFNEENQYCVGEFRSEGNQEKIVITGTLPGVQCGETLEIEGEWTTHPQYGKQLKINSFSSKLPSSLYGIRKYLSSGLIPGIGKIYAEKIVDYFKTDTFRIISEESARLKEVPGIGAHRAKSIKKAWDEQHALREVFMFLKTYGVTNSQCMRLVKTYGDTANLILKKNPYKVAYEIEGIGFKTADKIAINLGFSNESQERVEAGIQFALKELESDGHTCAPREYLAQRSAALLECNSSLIEKHINLLLANKQIVELPYGSLIQLPSLHKAEASITYSIGLIQHTPSTLPSIDFPKAIEWTQGRMGFLLDPQQIEAINTALSSKIAIITGGPGTGKTTILKGIVDILKAKKVKLTLAAPTGRAAQRMHETTGFFAQTIHRLLKIDPVMGTFVYNETNPLHTEFVIIDESSMIDTLLAASLLKAIPSNAHLVFVGDIHQLPSVGPGAVLQNLIQIGKIPTVKLDKIFRQSSRSQIVTKAHEILEGQVCLPPSRELLHKPSEDLHHFDFEFIKATTPESCINAIKYIYKNLNSFCRKGIDAINDVQVLVPMHKGISGISNINIELQKALNPNGKGVLMGNNTFAPGDKIIQLRNNYDKGIFNGDLGQILEMNVEEKSLSINFGGDFVELDRLDLPDLTLAYAISIHKSQGSEFPAVIIPLLKHHFVMLQRNLIYTAITRGREKVILVGDPVAYVMAVKNDKSTERYSGLKERLLSLLATG